METEECSKIDEPAEVEESVEVEQYTELDKRLMDRNFKVVIY